MIVTIDGPAGAGKSTVARGLAKRLGFELLDTGAMYRAVALAGFRAGIDWEQPEKLAQLAGRADIDYRDGRIFLDGEDVSGEIRTSTITKLTKHAANNKEVRQRLVELQREIAQGRDVVTEGRDQGTVAFPDAECKIFLTASPEQRARRRTRDLQAAGEAAEYEEVLAQQNLRDQQDQTREIGGLKAAADAVVINTDDMDQEQVLDQLEQLVRQRAQS